MKNIIYLFQIYYFLVLLFFSGYVLGKEEENNGLKLDKDNIKVYIFSGKNSPIGTFKAVSHINASIDSVLAVLLDNESYIDWIHECNESNVIENISFDKRYHYQIINMPLPFINRDLISYSIMKSNPVKKSITITSIATSNFCGKQQSDQCNKINQSDLVRISKSVGIFKLEPAPKGTKITWMQYTDPGGNLPNWLINQFLVDTPYWTLRKLSQKVKEEKYKYAKLIFNNKGVVINIKNIPSKKPKINIEIYPTF